MHARSLLLSLGGVALLALPSAAQAAAQSTPAGYLTSVLIGTPDPNGKVPALNAVSGAGVSNLSVADPVSVLTHGQAYVITMASQDVSYSGSCTDSWTLNQSGTKLASGIVKKYDCSAGTYWIWIGGTPAIPDSPGPATLTGTVKMGTTSAKVTIPVLIQ